MAKTADRIRSHGILPPDRQVAPLATKTQELLGDTSTMIVVADEIAAWVHSDRRSDTTIDDYGDLAPPWPVCWVEYPSATGRQRRGVLFRDITSITETRENNLAVEAIAQAKADAEQNGFPAEDLCWIVNALLYIEDAHHRVYGPTSSYTVALDRHGIMQGNAWMQFAPGGYADADIKEEEWILAAIDPALTTISLTHMHNITVEKVTPPIVRRDRKRDAKPPLRYHVLKLHLPRRVSSGRAGNGEGFASGIHPVAGHRAHYGECCGDAHPPRGKLFGKLTGVYWVPSHLRGSKDAGEVRTEIEARHG